jgi:hypothetical protein
MTMDFTVHILLTQYFRKQETRTKYVSKNFMGKDKLGGIDAE